jgi:hypothetical protein
MVLHGKQLQLLKLFSLQSLITLKRFRIYNPWELNGFTIQYRVNKTTVDNVYARIAQSCSYLIVKVTEPTNTLTSYAVRVIWVVEDLKAGKSAVETLYTSLVFNKSDNISISPPPDATHVQPVPTAATLPATGLSAAVLKSRVRDRSNNTVVLPLAKKTKKPVGSIGT